MTFKSKNGYGTAPIDLGLINPFNSKNPIYDAICHEMMFSQYCPVKLAKQNSFVLPAHLRQFEPFLYNVEKDLGTYNWYINNIYLTVKRLWVNASNPGNRPGWHSDGFMSDDLNYIWSDSNPTEVWEAKKPEEIWLTQDHGLSLAEMEWLCNDEGKKDLGERYYLKPKHFYKLDDKVLHRVAENFTPGVRTFVKVSVSKEIYNLKGNAINPYLSLDVPYVDRQVERNCPIGEK